MDRKREPGRFLITGSAIVLLVPRVAASLAGRMEIVTPWPFSQGELEGALEGFIDAAFATAPPKLAAGERTVSLVERVLRGGFEVDLLLERRSGEVVGIEVKSAATVSPADFKGLRALAEAGKVAAPTASIPRRRAEWYRACAPRRGLARGFALLYWAQRRRADPRQSRPHSR